MRKRILSLFSCLLLLFSLLTPLQSYGESKRKPDSLKKMQEQEALSPAETSKEEEISKEEGTNLESFASEEKAGNAKEEAKSSEDRSKESDERDERGLTSQVTPYVLVEKSSLLFSEKQNIAVLLEGLEENITEACLLGSSPSGEDFHLPTHTMSGNAAVFSYQFTEEDELGRYTFSGIEVNVNGEKRNFSFADYQMTVQFSLLASLERRERSAKEDFTKDSQGLEMEMVESDDKGNQISHTNVEEALREAGVVRTDENGEEAFSAYQSMVIYLDPGHDSRHAGARGNGLKEEDVVLKIAKYAKEELEKYEGVTVYMSRSGPECPYPGTTAAQDNAKRVEDAAAKGADVYVSFHCNASPSSSPRGALVFAPNNNYNPLVGNEGQKLAEKVLAELTALGLPVSWSGVVTYNSQSGDKYPDGSAADYYQIPRLSKLKGFPGIIIEHAFITNAYDAANYLTSDDSLRRLAHADVEGIVKYYGLSKSKYKLVAEYASPRGLGSAVLLTAQGFPQGSEYQFLMTPDVGRSWYELRGYAKENTLKWTPSDKGAYMLCVRAKLPDNSTAEAWIDHYDIVEPEVAVNKLKFDLKDDLSVDLSADIESNAGGLTYQYEVRKKANSSAWRPLNGFNESSTANFKPDEFGDYEVRLQVKTLTGKIKTREENFHVEEKSQIRGFTVNPKEAASVGDKIILSGNIKKYNNSKLQYDFMEYDGEHWAYISGGSKEAKAEWIPKKVGVYGLCLQIRNEKNQVLDKKVINYRVEKDINAPRILGFSSDVISPQRPGKNIILRGEVFNPQNRPLLHQYLVYNGKGWREIASSSKTGSAQWKPDEKGGYLLCYQIKDGQGNISQKFLSYNITGESLKVNSLSISKDKVGKYKIRTSMNIEEPKLTYTYYDYSYTKNQWSLIKNDSKEAEILWEPEIGGTHLILVRVKDESGKVYEADKGLDVESDMKLVYFAPNKKGPQGVGDTIKLQAYISTSMKEKIHYRYLVYNQQFWKELGEGYDTTEFDWSPTESGKYWLCLQGTDSSGRMIQNIFEYEIEKRSVDIQEISLIEAKDKAYTFDARVKVTGAGIKYSYSVYDVANGQWIGLTSESKEKKVTYFPKKEGYYWICLEAKFPNEKGVSKIEEFHVTSPKIQSFQMQGSDRQKVNAAITVWGRPVFEGRKDLDEQYMIHKVGDGNRWEYISLSPDKKSAVWTAKEKGDYWICYQVTNALGNSEQKIISFTVR